VDCILLTHGHLDHAGGADGLRNELVRLQGGTVPIIGPDERDAFLLSDIAAQAARARLTGMGNVTVDRYVTDGESLPVLGRSTRCCMFPAIRLAMWCSMTPRRWFCLCGGYLVSRFGRTH
jgi:glyoxylase-like metal-dependent hydrolase (beta-lactamase superfamily II)